jgi:hypothetical protein
LPTAGHTGIDERTAPIPANHREPDSIFFAAHIARRTGAGTKALQPLTRSRSARALPPTPLRHAHPGREEAQTPLTDVLDAMKELGVGPRSA